MLIKVLAMIEAEECVCVYVLAPSLWSNPLSVIFPSRIVVIWLPW